VAARRGISLAIRFRFGSRRLLAGHEVATTLVTLFAKMKPLTRRRGMPAFSPFPYR